MKARSMLLMALPNKHLMTFNQYKDAKSLFAAIETRFGGNEATKKTQKTILKQMYENFKVCLMSGILMFWSGGINLILDTMSINDLYNNFKIVEQEVTESLSSNSSSQNMDFVSSPSTNRTNEVHTAYGVSTASTQSSTASTQVGTASTQNSTANLSDATIYAFLANQSNESQLVHEDLEQIHEDNLEEMDLKTVQVEKIIFKAMVAIDGVDFDWSYMTEDEVPTNMVLMAFLDSEIDRRAIPHYISWRHPDSAITAPKHLAGSYSQVDVRRLSAFVIKLRDIPEEVLVLSGLIWVWKSRTRDPIFKDSSGNGLEEEVHHDVRPTFQRLPLYYTPSAANNAAIPAPTPKDLATNTPNSKVLAKAEYCKKRMASTSGAAPSQIAKQREDDDDPCYEILIITPIRSAATIPAGGNHGGGSDPSVAEGPSNRGKAIMNDAIDIPNKRVGCFQAFTGPNPVSRDHIGDAFDKDFFPFTHGPYYATYPKDGVVAVFYEVSREKWDGPHQPTLSILIKKVFKDPNICKIVVDQFPTPGEMVRIEALTDDRLAGKMSVLHCLMMSHGGELLAQYRGLLKSYGKYVQSVDSRLMSLQQKLTSFQAKAKGKERKKKSRRSDAQKGDQIAAAQGYLDDVCSLIEAYKHSLAKKDAEILRLKAFPPEFMSFFKGTSQMLWICNSRVRMPPIYVMRDSPQVNLKEATLPTLHIGYVVINTNGRWCTMLSKGEPMTLLAENLENPE
uniref:Uncharacterized protein n=1 Tax=Tanacetum cinerariifolium TaxID=118510 RepID=A0A6L2MFI7_TANCI|nr:hypothetical protein [Tanacetum cinerariifolium]